MQIIGVRFQKPCGGYHQKVYYYNCTVKNVAIGEAVIAPVTDKTTNPEVMVCALNVDPNSIPYSSFRKTIERRAVKHTRFGIFVRDLVTFIKRLPYDAWNSLKWDWDHRKERNNRAKRKRKSADLYGDRNH